MADVGVGETLQHAFGVIAAFGIGQGDEGDDLIKHHPPQERRDHRVIHHLADGIESTAKRGQDAGGVRAIEDAYLARAVRLQILGPHHVKTGFVQRKTFGLIRRAFDHPQMKRLGGHQ